MNFSKLRISAVAAMALVLPAQAASAAIITYHMAGSGAASVDGQSYSGDFSLVAKGDTASAFEPVAGVTAVVLDSVEISFGGTTFYGLDPAVFFTNNGANFHGFNHFHLGMLSNLVNFSFAPGESYDALSDFDPVSVTPRPLPPPQFVRPYTTSAGLMTGQSVRVATFWASVAAPAVPEPASWAMLIGGFALAGGALRTRSRVSVAFS